MGGSPEVDDSKAPAEVQKGALGAKLYGRDLALLEATLILFSRALLFGRSLSQEFHFAVHGCQFYSWGIGHFSSGQHATLYSHPLRNLMLSARMRNTVKLPNNISIL